MLTTDHADAAAPTPTPHTLMPPAPTPPTPAADLPGSTAGCHKIVRILVRIVRIVRILVRI
jgi:hypothetical protein